MKPLNNAVMSSNASPPTSRVANQLRGAGISADTLQGFLVRPGQPSPDRHLYIVDESSLASTKQLRDFLAKLESSDRVLLIGDTRQHQSVEAGKPFEQLVNAGMKTTQLHQIVRQQSAPELLKAVEHLSRGEVGEGVPLLEQQGAFRRLPMHSTVSRRLHEATLPARTTPSSSHPTTSRAVRSITPCVPNCKSSAESPRKIIPCVCSRRAQT
ncbi:MAG: AAA family ATPase [Acidobacteriota bacterium]|nr:AAA family ATPase [Acidobacteriota bacterium]